MHSKPPVSSHPLFPIVVALWFAALFGLSSFAIRISLLEDLVQSTQIDQFISAAAPPLGQTARILLAITLAVIGAIIGGILARIISRIGKKASAPPRKTKPGIPAEELYEDYDTPAAPRSPASFGQKQASQAELNSLESSEKEPTRKRALSLDEHNEAEEVEEDYAAMPEIAPLPGMNNEIFDVSSCDFSNSAVIDIGRDNEEPLELQAYTAANINTFDLISDEIDQDTTSPAEQTSNTLQQPTSQKSSSLPFSLDEPEVIEMLEPIDLAAFNAEMGHNSQLSVAPLQEATPNIQFEGTQLGSAPIPVAYEAPQTSDLDKAQTNQFADPQDYSGHFNQHTNDADQIYANPSNTQTTEQFSHNSSGHSTFAMAENHMMENPSSIADFVNQPSEKEGFNEVAQSSEGLNAQQLLERLSQAISQRKYTKNQSVTKLSQPAPPSPPQGVPAALRPINFNAYEDENDDDDSFNDGPFGYVPQRSISFSPKDNPAPFDQPTVNMQNAPSSEVARIPQPYTPDEQMETDVVEENYSSLLNVKRPTTQKANFFRIEEPDYSEEGENIETESVVIFPGHGLQGGQRFVAPGNFDQTGSATTNSQMPAKRSDEQQFKGIAGEKLPFKPGTSFAAPAIDPEETERALRSALATLQRMTSAS